MRLSTARQNSNVTTQAREGIETLSSCTSITFPIVTTQAREGIETTDQAAASSLWLVTTQAREGIETALV